MQETIEWQFISIATQLSTQTIFLVNKTTREKRNAFTETLGPITRQLTMGTGVFLVLGLEISYSNF